MQSIIAYILGGILLLLFLLPCLTGNLEKKELNERTRVGIEGDFIKLSNGYTHYELKGAKNNKLVVLVHGNAAPLFSWDNNVDALTNEGFSVLRYDVYGHGFSDRPKLRKYDREFYDKQLYELVKILNITEPFYLVGTSQGGNIAAYFAANHPELVSKIAFLAPYFDESVGQKGLAMFRSIIGDYMLSVIGDKMITNPQKVLHNDTKVDELRTKLEKQMHFKGKKRAFIANVRGNSFDNFGSHYQTLSKSKIPVLLTWGENDISIPKESMERMKKLFCNIEYREIKHASHLAHYEYPHVINPILIDFFKK